MATKHKKFDWISCIPEFKKDDCVYFHTKCPEQTEAKRSKCTPHDTVQALCPTSYLPPPSLHPVIPAFLPVCVPPSLPACLPACLPWASHSCFHPFTNRKFNFCKNACVVMKCFMKETEVWKKKIIMMQKYMFINYTAKVNDISKGKARQNFRCHSHTC